MKKNFRGIGVWAACIIIAYILYSFVAGGSQHKETMVYSDLVNAIKQESVTSMTVNKNTVTATLKGGYEHKVKIPSLEVLQNDVGKEIEEQMQNGTLIQEAYESRISWTVVTNVLSIILFVLFFYFIIIKRGGMSSFGSIGSIRSKSGAADEVKFSDVAGADEEKAELEELVEFLKHPDRFIKLGARIPKGVLLVGSPGTGKTLLAKAVAGEAGVSFFSISGSDFVEMYVGVGASRVRDLFEQAKRSRPCIIFVDEIDAVGRRRGAGLGGGHDEREQTLNQLLVEMDGFGANNGVIVIAATNRPDVLDPALLRPGRFDRQIVVDLPDVKGRKAILEVHSRKKPLADEVELERIAKSTVGYSGADLENLLNEAAIYAARREHEKITLNDIEDANLKVMMGNEKRSRVLSENEKRLTAYHEAGHAVLARLLDSKAAVNRVSIIPRGRAGGFTMYLPEEEDMYESKNEMLNHIIVMLGGRAAEELTMDDISTGASNDIERATSLARQMVKKYGMSSVIGPVFYDSGGEVFLGRDYGQTRDYSEKMAADIDMEVKRIMTGQYEKTLVLLREQLPRVKAVAELLLEKETIDGEEFERCYESAETREDI